MQRKKHEVIKWLVPVFPWNYRLQSEIVLHMADTENWQLGNIHQPILIFPELNLILIIELPL